jgi:hypothetical protein
VGESTAGEELPPPPGHGRNGADAYRGAQRVVITHARLHRGDVCQGKVYEQQESKQLVRIIGQAPIRATVYELQRLRCNLCGEVLYVAGPGGRE